jgi:hypothetical protein
MTTASPKRESPRTNVPAHSIARSQNSTNLIRKKAMSMSVYSDDSSRPQIRRTHSAGEGNLNHDVSDHRTDGPIRKQYKQLIHATSTIIQANP